MTRFCGGNIARLSVAFIVSAVLLQTFAARVAADADDPTQVVMLTNFLLTGNYGLPQQPQIQRMSVYHNYALVQLNGPLPVPGQSPSANPSSSAVVAQGAASPAGNASPVASPATTPTPSPSPSAGPSSFVAFKTHRNWIYLFSKTGTYNQNDLIAAGLPADVVSGLLFFLGPPRPLPSPS